MSTVKTPETTDETLDRREMGETLLAKTVLGEAVILDAKTTTDETIIPRARMFAYLGKIKNPVFYQVTIMDRTVAKKKPAPDERLQLAERMTTKFAELAAAQRNEKVDTLSDLAADLLRALRDTGALKDASLVLRAKNLGITLDPKQP